MTLFFDNEGDIFSEKNVTFSKGDILAPYRASGDVRKGENEKNFLADFGKSALWRRRVNGSGQNKLYREVECPYYC